MDDTSPDADELDLWFNTTDTPGTLMVSVAGAWVAVDPGAEPPMDEVWIGTVAPDPGVGTYESGSTSPGAAGPEGREPNGAWAPVGANEVVVGAGTRTCRPGERGRMWTNLDRRRRRQIEVRLAGSGTRSRSSPSPRSRSAPATRHCGHPGRDHRTVGRHVDVARRHEGVGQRRLADRRRRRIPAAPQEVEVGRPPSGDDRRLWYDTTNSPAGTLRANNNGVWETIGGNEV